MRNLLVVAVMIKCKDKYLFIKQDKVGGAFPGCLLTVGGKIEENETPEEAIKRDGYITEDSALRIASQTYIKEGERKVSVKEYIKKIGKGSIELIEKDNEKYWSIELNYDGYAYKEEAKIEIDYYTGEVRFNDIVSATYID